jgi:hypothetical protein
MKHTHPEIYKLFKKVMLFAVLALFMPLLLVKIPCVSTKLFSLGEPGSLGDTFNGLTNPFLTIIAIWLTFLAFYIQYKANRKQWDYANKEQFERKFLLLLELLNTQEAQCRIEHVGEAKQAFHYMFYEFKAILFFVIKSNVFKGKRDRKKLELSLAYVFFVDGASYSSIDRVISDFKCRNKDFNLTKNIRNKINEINDLLLEKQKESLIEEAEVGVFMLYDYRNRKIKYFDGHRCRLISYFRNFCMVIDHLNNNGEKDTDSNVPFYIKTLRYHLSEHELALMWIVFIHGDEEIGNKGQISDFFEKVLEERLINDAMDCKKELFTQSIRAKKRKMTCKEKERVVQ